MKAFLARQVVLNLIILIIVGLLATLNYIIGERFVYTWQIRLSFYVMVQIGFNLGWFMADNF